jgi:hypothetical protein
MEGDSDSKSSLIPGDIRMLLFWGKKRQNSNLKELPD